MKFCALVLKLEQIQNLSYTVRDRCNTQQIDTSQNFSNSTQGIPKHVNPSQIFANLLLSSYKCSRKLKKIKFLLKSLTKRTLQNICQKKICLEEVVHSWEYLPDKV